jgi:hypothetical protein
LYSLLKGNNKEIHRIFRTKENIFGAFEFFFMFESTKHFSSIHMAKCIWFKDEEYVTNNTYKFDVSPKPTYVLKDAERKSYCAFVSLKDVSSTGVACGKDGVDDTVQEIDEALTRKVYLIPTHPHRECFDRLILQ